MRLYSQKDIDRIHMILRLTRELGVNLAGVDIILQFKDKIDDMEGEIKDLREKLAKSMPISTSRSLVSSKKIYELIIFGE
jgi:MerR family transcriptional regulator/heat shock protein HspR